MSTDAYLPLVTLSAQAITAAETGTLIAASDRLRRECRYAYDHARMTNGETAWRAPSISGFDTLLRRDYQREASINPDCPTLLSAVEQHALFRGCAPEGLVHLTPLFEDAWQQLHAWQLDTASAAFEDSENTRVFAYWARTVKAQLASRNALTAAELASQNYPESPQHGPLHLLGFDVLTQAQRSWIERARAGGTVIAIQETQETLATSSHTSGAASRFTSSIAELTAAVAWARERLEAAPTDQPLPRIGIVVPELLQQHATVDRLLHSQLEASGAREKVLYNLGGGLPLAQHPLVASAMALLSNIHNPAHYSELERLLVDPALPAINTNKRLPSSCAEFMRLQDVPPDICTEPLRVILRHVQGWQDSGTQMETGSSSSLRRTTREWWQAAASVLRNARWHTARKDSEGYQATNALLELLMSDAPKSETLTPWSEAFALLASVAGQTLFAPAGQPAPLQVLGYLEALELEFDHLWITGMSDTAWPTPVVSNPLLPMVELTAAGAPRTTYSSELHFAQNWLQRVTHTPVERRCSFVNEEPAEDGNEAAALTGISALLAHWQPTPAESSSLLNSTHVANHWHPTLAHWQGELAAERIELIATEPTPERLIGTPPAPPNLRSATRRLQDQAACPMRGWATHQLGIDDPIPPHTLPNPLERGDILHEALDRVFTQIKSSLELAALGQAEEQLLCNNIAHQVIDEKMHRYSKSIRTMEAERLLTQLGQFLSVERTRGEFVVNDTESKVRTSIGPFEFGLRLDRVDDTPNGQFVIDYKSSAPSNSTLLDERLSAPQIPLYVLLLMANDKPLNELTFNDPVVTAGAFAQVKPGAAKYVGVRAASNDLGIKSLDDKHEWSALLTRWRDQLSLLTTEIADGYATAAPTKTACNNCHLHALCRYHLRYD